MTDVNLKKLIANRGYVKAAITRMYKAFDENVNFTPANILARREKIHELYKDYERLNVEIIVLNDTDNENIEEVEGKYFEILALLGEKLKIEQHQCAQSPSLKHPSSTKVNLPTINIPPFTGKYSDYLSFIEMFKSLIQNDSSLDNIQKLHYLRSLLRGEALDLVKNLPLVAHSYEDAMTILGNRYYNKYKIISDHINSLLDLNIMTKSTSGHIREFVSSTKQTISALKNLDIKIKDWDPILICILTRKLDLYTARAYQLERDIKTEPTMVEFLDFLEKRALALENSEPTPMKPGKLAVNAAAVELKQECYYCKCTDHKIYNCKTFRLLPSAERYNFVKEQSLCDTCLNNHKGKCRFHFRCSECKKGHNSLIHIQKPEPVVMLSENNENNILLPTARVKLFGQDDKEVQVKAILDSASQASLITAKAIKVLGLSPMRNDTKIIGVTNAKNNIKYCIPLEIHSLKSPFKTMVNFYVVDKITCFLPQTKFDTSTLGIPHNIQLADAEYNIPSEINMLIGADIFFQVLLPPDHHLQPVQSCSAGLQKQNLTSTEGREVATQCKREAVPHIINTQFGHVIAGTLPAKQVSQFVSLLCLKCESNIDNTIQSFWDTEKVPEVYKEQISEYGVTEEIFESTVKLNNNKFQVDLPLKLPLSEIPQTLGNSFNLALHRFLNLEKRLHKDHNLLEDYKKFIHEYIELGHAHFVNLNSYNFNKDPLYFLPHHAVINENSKTTRTRVVFDGSMKTNKKVSLNDILLNGPVVQRDLFDIMLLYRFGTYTFNTDIKKMFRNILVNPEHTSLQNILWRAEPSESIQCIRLDTVTYGLKSSSYLATRCLLKLADKYCKEYPLACFILKNCTYVDDVLYTNSNLTTMLDAKQQLKELLKLGGFEAHKWSSNCIEILSDIPESQCQLTEIELQKDNCSIKALGLTIDTSRDCFVIKCPENINTSRVTKRTILSEISKFYDPLGFISPIIVKAKVIMQRLWLEKVGWDSKVPDAIAHDWLQFASNLASMQAIYLNRYIQITSTTETVQLIGFADASSSTGYGCCIYLRIIEQTGEAKLALLCSKSRINPRTNPLTIPKLELNACLLLVKLMTKVVETLKVKINIDNVFLFSDSQIVLSWIQSNVTNLKAYVSNRIRVIQDLSKEWIWRYIDTQNNPADLISRGADPHVLASSSMWWKGPPLLHNRDYSFTENTQLLVNNLLELEVTTTPSDRISLLIQKQVDFFKFLDKYSDITKMKRVFAYMLRFCHNIKPNNSKITSNYLTSAELNIALAIIIKHQQEVNFEHEIKLLSDKQELKGSLKPLCPFLDSMGMLRVGGRLQNSELSYSQKHPIILPKESRVTELIILQEHLRLLHAGPKLLLSQLRQKYWLVNGMRQIKKITSKCLICFRMKAEAARQLMGSLPRQRVTASRPFQKVGLDYAGPIQVKNSTIRRAQIGKGYVCIFVCFVTKAIHLELASDLSTGTFLACLKRFVARRGLPTDIFCDNGSAFRGARNTLVGLYKINDSLEHQRQVQFYANQQGIQFHFIPSYSPVFAGLAEAAVKSMKFHLKRTLQKSILSYEQLNTVLCQIEAILNSRPLLPLTSDTADFSYLTPGHFLIGGPLASYPEPDVSNTPENRLKLWKLIESMRQHFWKVWHICYLNVLQSRPKWRDELPNVTVGSLVILREPNVPPLCWPMARIVKVFPGIDGKVRAFEVATPNGKTYTRSLSGISVLPIND